MENSVIEKEHDQAVSKPKHHSEFKYTPPSPEENGICWSDFLNPRSMLTPGVAGSLIMLIANTLWVQFAVPQKWSALTLSFLLIVPILVKFAASLFENIIYFVFNGLIVFALAVNANFVGEKLQQVSTVDHASLDTQKINATLKSSIAMATSGANQKIKPINQMQLASNDDQGISNLRLVSDNEKNAETDSSKKKESKQGNEKNKSEENNNDREFFKKWF